MSQTVVKEGVRFIRFLKDILIGVFYSKFYEFYSIDNSMQCKKKL
jgi:hypothetical protein